MKEKSSKNILYVLGGVLLSLPLFFIINYFLFEMYRENLVNLISGMAALFASILTLFTLMEIKKQRFNVYRPSLKIAHKSGGKFEFESATELFDKSMKLKVLNVGFGAATDIVLHLKSDENIFSKLNKVSSEHLLKINNEGLDTETITLSTENKQSTLFSKNSCSRFFQYLLPVQGTESSLEFELPGFYLYAIALLNYDSFEKYGGFEDLKLGIELNYYDLAGDQHSITHFIQIGPIMLGNKEIRFGIKDLY